jgi:iron complex outermembrane receptor protein
MHYPPLTTALHPLALAVLLALGGSLAYTPACAQSAAGAQTTPYDLPAGPLDATLTGMARRAGRIIVIDPALVGGRTASPVRGSMTLEQAFAQALAGSGLEIAPGGDGSYTLRKAAPKASKPEAAARKESVLPVVTVKAGAEREAATGPVLGYVAKRSTTGTKTDTAIIETPQAISVVTADQVKTQKAATLLDALQYSAGVMGELSALGTTQYGSDTVFLRGFQADPQFGSFYRDGMRFGANIYYGGQEPYGLERIEVLKGPSSVLYGATAPGGIVNTVSKRPSQESLHELSLEYGSHDRKVASADFGGALDEDGMWSYRLTGLVRESGTPVDFGFDDRTYIAPALTWRPSGQTSLTLLSSYQRSRSSTTNYLPVTGTALPNVNGQLPRDRFLGEPDWNSFDEESWTLGYLFEHAFSENFKLRHSLRRYSSAVDYKYVLFGDVGADNRTVSRSARRFVNDADILTSDTNLEYAFGTGAIRHTALVGVDTTRVDRSSDRERGALNAIDAYAPVYDPRTVTTSAWRQFRDKEEKTGFYVQDQMKIAERWTVLLGGRYDRMHMTSLSLHSPADNTDEKDSAATGRAGVVYQFDNGLAPYASFSQSFEPQSGRDRNGQRFSPTEGEQYEAGLRYQPPGTQTLLSAALYQLTRSNVLTPDPVDTDFSVQTGEVRSRGLELEAKTTLGANVDLIAAYSYTDARVTQSSTANEKGMRFNGTPYHIVSLWADYRLSALDLAGWKVGGGVRYVGERPDDTSGAAGGPAYTLFDARLAYEREHWLFAFNLKNLTDKTYFPSLCYSNRCTYGAPRTVTATVGYRW